MDRTRLTRCLDIGGRDVEGSARDVFRYTTWDVMNIRQTPASTFVHDATVFDPSIGPFDLVLCTEVLEHVEHWRLILQNAFKWLADGGHFIVTAAGIGRPVHSGVNQTPKLEPGEHYANLHADTLRFELKVAGFKTIHACHQRGLDVQAWATR
jgi:SAM-dependent methyltransferase